MSRTVAVIGASRNREKFGNKALRAFEQQGYRVIPVHPPGSRGRRTPGVPVRCSTSPRPIDMATVYVPAQDRPAVSWRNSRRKGVGEVWLNPGADERRGGGAGTGARPQHRPGVQHHRHRRQPGSLLARAGGRPPRVAGWASAPSGAVSHRVGSTGLGSPLTAPAGACLYCRSSITAQGNPDFL